MGFLPYRLSVTFIGVVMAYTASVIAYFVDFRTSTLAVIIPTVVVSVISFLISISLFTSNKLPFSNKIVRLVILAQFVTALYISFSPYLFRFAMTPVLFVSLLTAGILTLFILLFTDLSTLSI